MGAKQKASDAEVLAAYEHSGSVQAAGKSLNMCGQSVYERLIRLGASTKINKFTEADRQRLRADYTKHRDTGTLRDLAAEMGRTVPFLSRQARALGLTNAAARLTGVGKLASLTDAELEAICEQFLRQSLTLAAWCRSTGYDDEALRRNVKKRLPGLWEQVSEKGRSSGKNRLYKNGRAFEYRIRDRLKSAGYFAMRSPGSVGPFDVLALRAGEIVMVECKLDGVCGVAQWNRLYDFAASVGATPVLADGSVPGGRMFRMTGRKTGSNQDRQPMTEWVAA